MHMTFYPNVELLLHHNNKTVHIKNYLCHNIKQPNIMEFYVMTCQHAMTCRRVMTIAASLKCTIIITYMYLHHAFYFCLTLYGLSCILFDAYQDWFMSTG